MKHLEAPTRLFDIPHLLFHRRPKQVCFRLGTAELTATTYCQQAECLALSLLQRGLRRGDVVALVSDNQPEWNLASMGVLAAGGAMLPLPKGLTAEEYLDAFACTQTRLLFVDSADLCRRFRLLLPQADTLRSLVCFSPCEDCVSLADYLHSEAASATASQLRRRQNLITTDDISTVYYSGNGTCLQLTHRQQLLDAQAATATLPTREAAEPFCTPLCTQQGYMLNLAYQLLGRPITYPTL